MRSTGVYVLCAADLNQSFGRTAEGPGCVYHIVKEDYVLVAHVADYVHNLGLIGSFTALIDNGEV